MVVQTRNRWSGGKAKQLPTDWGATRTAALVESGKHRIDWKRKALNAPKAGAGHEAKHSEVISSAHPHIHSRMPGTAGRHI
ncbi:hypothetical protein [Paraburkholderia sp. RL17-381-BIF-C]|uniref:hypothetical protein n=1 Tax=Paraburkholderia sp. RL17-381-BIF-C TaxID=3031635 RepID=UPI0038BC5975